jgi:hypothetical protein
MIATFDEGRTTNANNQNRTLAEEITDIQTFLTSKGHTNGLPTTGQGQGTTTGTGAPTR